MVEEEVTVAVIIVVLNTAVKVVDKAVIGVMIGVRNVRSKMNKSTATTTTTTTTITTTTTATTTTTKQDTHTIKIKLQAGKVVREEEIDGEMIEDKKK